MALRWRLGGDGRHRRIKADRVKAASRSELQCAGLEVLRWPCAGGLVEMEGTADSRFPPLKLLAFHPIAASPSVFSVAISQALRGQLGMDIRIRIPAQVGGESIEEASADFGKESADDAVSAFAFGMLQVRAGLDQIRQHLNVDVLVVCSAKEPIALEIVKVKLGFFAERDASNCRETNQRREKSIIRQRH